MNLLQDDLGHIDAQGSTVRVLTLCVLQCKQAQGAGGALTSTLAGEMSDCMQAEAWRMP